MDGLTLVFDLDGTLVDTAPDLAGAANHVLAHLGLSGLPAETLRPWVSYGARRMITEALAQSRNPLPEAAIDELLERFLAFYSRNIAQESRPFAGVVAELDRLRALGITLAVCTNKREELSRLLLHELRLTSYFAAIAGRDTFPVSKPHPDHLIGAIRLAGGDRGRAIMIGDSAVDIAAARAADVPVIGVSFGYTETPVRELSPDAVIDSYAELWPAVQRLVLRSGARPGRGGAG
jgi:phosphoglycolate phosphatase